MIADTEMCASKTGNLQSSPVGLRNGPPIDCCVVFFFWLFLVVVAADADVEAQHLNAEHLYDSDEDEEEVLEQMAKDGTLGTQFEAQVEEYDEEGEEEGEFHDAHAAPTGTGASWLRVYARARLRSQLKLATLFAVLLGGVPFFFISTPDGTRPAMTSATFEGKDEARDLPGGCAGKDEGQYVWSRFFGAPFFWHSRLGIKVAPARVGTQFRSGLAVESDCCLDNGTSKLRVLELFRTGSPAPCSASRCIRATCVACANSHGVGSRACI